ncbi:hypothetical protein GSI_12132 [Ganoderma sinense ZZ0214-1]|uniref:Uncharacterized protein n=1 Tax=Ganoderma sinense ZZ0214-1 TaxID=1077348 RepID=A0A2G8RXY2_9APHY|nr:hypothetical protein GSI_12132 [Ganoderma sinense ZZ0214-1]
MQAMASCTSPVSPSALIIVPVTLVRTGLTFLVLGTVLSSFLIPIAVVLFFFSTPRLRRQPTFVFNVIVIVLGLMQGVIIFFEATGPMLNKPNISIASSTLLVSLNILVPLCAESVLIFRVVAVYPPHILSRTRRLALYGPIVLLKVTRVINAFYFIHLLLGGPHAQDPYALIQSIWRVPNGKLEWFLQLVDDTYVSGIFLYRLHAGTRNAVGRLPLHSASARSSRYLERLKTLFWISVSNFVFPVLLNVVQLIFILRDPDFTRGLLVFMVNNYVTIIGVLLATIWASGSEVRERASARWMMPPAPGAAARKSFFARPVEKDPSALSRKRRPSSAPPTEKAVVVHVEERGEVSPSSVV